MPAVVGHAFGTGNWDGDNTYGTYTSPLAEQPVPTGAQAYGYDAYGDTEWSTPTYNSSPAAWTETLYNLGTTGIGRPWESFPPDAYNTGGNSVTTYSWDSTTERLDSETTPASGQFFDDITCPVSTFLDIIA